MSNTTKSQNERYELNCQLAQMLKGGVIMDVTTRNRQKLQKQPVPAPSWHWKEFLQTFVPQAAYPE